MFGSTAKPGGLFGGGTTGFGAAPTGFGGTSTGFGAGATNTGDHLVTLLYYIIIFSLLFLASTSRPTSFKNVKILHLDKIIKLYLIHIAGFGGGLNFSQQQPTAAAPPAANSAVQQQLLLALASR